MNFEQRAEERVPRDLRVAVVEQRQTHSGLLRDISPGGMSFRCDGDFPRFILLTVQVLGPDGESHRMMIQVRWRTDDSDLLTGRFQQLYGCQMVEQEAKLSRMIQKIIQDFNDVRAAKRHECLLDVAISSSGDRWLQHRAGNISLGGVFIPLQDGLVDQLPWEEVRLTLKLPQTDDPVRCIGRVAHVVTEELAKTFPLPPGVGFEFLSFDGGDREILERILIPTKMATGADKSN